MLDSNEKFEIKQFSAEDWHKILSNFADANLFQTVEFAAVNWGIQNIEHAVLYRDNRPVSACQMRIIRFPMKAGALICSNAGPLWKAISFKSSIDVLNKMVFKLKEAYTMRKHYTLILKPWVFIPGSERQTVLDTFEKSDFVRRDLFYKVAYLPLDMPLENIKKSLDIRWRQGLSKAEKQELRTEMGSDPELFRSGIPIYKEMVQRKRFIGEDISKYVRINDLLPETKKIRIVICYKGDEPLSFLSYSLLGDTAIALFAATSDKSLKFNSSYLCWWRLIEVLKSENVPWLNLGGINKKQNPGSYRFKSSIYKKIGYECTPPGQFWYHGSLLSRYACNFLWGSKLLMHRGRQILEKRFVRKIGN